MKLRDEQGWNDCVVKNTDPYGKGVVDYARTWAELMEAELAQGKVLAWPRFPQSYCPPPNPLPLGSQIFCWG